MRVPGAVWIAAVATAGGAVSFSAALLAPLAVPLEPRPLQVANPAEQRTAGDTAGMKSWPELAPFRRSRRPAPRTYAAVVAPPPPAEPAVPRPVLLLRGVILGATPRALIEGVPGVEGARAMAVGDRVGDLRIVGISDSVVRVAFGDMAWRIALARSGS